ncbi:MAG TPA: hypothetical protein VMG10_33120, partial [Gemmataceae bacterium]|nr:hypothetical protein [Gemmataceae bacterium]
SKQLVILFLVIYAALVCLATAWVLAAGVQEGNALPAAVLTLPWGLVAPYLFDTYGALAFVAWMVISAAVNGWLFCRIFQAATKPRPPT